MLCLILQEFFFNFQTTNLSVELMNVLSVVSFH